ncbi:family 31 glycosyltransferase [Melampsora americana]|nr:family 31 glycosyltransferase [Melampsora americana]
MNHKRKLKTTKSIYYHHDYQEEEEEGEEEGSDSIINKLTHWIHHQLIPHHQSILPDSIHHHHHSSSSTKSKHKTFHQIKLTLLFTIIIIIIYSVYHTFTWILDQPNHLELDPIIDPITFQIKPTGDPTRKIKSTLSTQSSSITTVSIQQEFQQRQSSFNLKISHAIHRNITQAKNQLKNPKIAKYDPLEEEDHEEDRLDSLTLEKNLTKPFVWYPGDSNLRNNRPVHQFKCDQTQEKKRSSLLFIGIFTRPERYSHRNLIRTLIKSDLPHPSSDHHQAPPLIDLVFISGPPKNEHWKYLIEVENQINSNDTIILPNLDQENLDLGKTFAFFNWISDPLNDRWRNLQLKSHSIHPHPFGPPRFVMKSDDDTFLVIPNLIKEFQNLDCNSNIYWGTSQGSNPLFDSYFRGLAYALSWPLVEWIGTSKMSYESQVGIEDARVGAWLSELDPKVDRLNRIDLGWKMGDWNQLEIDQDSIALHWIKSIEWFPMIKLKVLEAWNRSEQVYRWDWFLNSTTSLN